MDLSIPEAEIVSAMRYDNPWWTGTLDAYDGFKPRGYLPGFLQLVASRRPTRAVVLLGPRRVGKTVMIHHCLRALREGGQVGRRQVYLSVESPTYTNQPLERLFAMARRATGQEDPAGYTVCFDEIQYLPQWELHLKSLVERYPDTKFVASGSAAAALQRGATESGAGRFTEYMLPPLTFYEFVGMIDRAEVLREETLAYGGRETPWALAQDIDELNELFVDYVNFGGYPEVALSREVRRNAQRYLRNEVVDKVLLRDLPTLYGISNVTELNSLFKVIAYQTGNEIAYADLTSQSGLSRPTVEKYLGYLEGAFLIRRVAKVDRQARRFRRQSAFKVYLTNSSLRAALFAPTPATDPTRLGNLAETAIFGQWLQRDYVEPFYARWKRGREEGEIDLVAIDHGTQRPLWAVEMKWSDKAINHVGSRTPIIAFAREHGLSEVLITSRTVRRTWEVDGVRVTVVPSAEYAYNVGRRTLSPRKL